MYFLNVNCIQEEVNKLFKVIYKDIVYYIYDYLSILCDYCIHKTGKDQ